MHNITSTQIESWNIVSYTLHRFGETGSRMLNCEIRERQLSYMRTCLSSTQLFKTPKNSMKPKVTFKICIDTKISLPPSPN